MFLGEHRHSLDDKGRLTFPAKFRKQLAEGCVITKGQDGCLVVFDMAGWEQYVQQARSLTTLDHDVRLFARSVFASAHDGVPDKQGRITIPPALREYAQLGHDVAVIGMDDRIEVWDASEWARVAREADGAFSQISQVLAERSHPERSS